MPKVKIGLISDTHNRHKGIEIEPCDILICSGDFTSMGYKHEAQSFLSWFAKQPATYQIFIAGNHERGWQKKEQWLDVLLAGWTDDRMIYLEDSGCEILGIKIWGSPWQPYFCNWEFNLQRGRELAEKWALIPDDTNILITHGPPYGIDDYIPWEWVKPTEHDNMLGCKDLAMRVRHLEHLKLHVFGHIHLDDRNEIKEQKMPGSETVFVNASILNNKYEIQVKPHYFNYEL